MQEFSQHLLPVDLAQSQISVDHMDIVAVVIVDIWLGLISEIRHLITV